MNNFINKQINEQNFIIKIANSRNHKILTGVYNNCKSELTVICLTHNQTYKTTYHNYKRSKFGTRCCSSLKGKQRPVEVKQKISVALKGKPKKYVSWLKNLTGPKHPSYKHGRGNKRAETHEELTKLNFWKKAVLKNYNYKCFVTEAVKKKPGVGLLSKTEDFKSPINKRDQRSIKEPLVIHHLDSWDNNIALRYRVTNGVVLLKSIHFAFHNEYGFGNNTALQFEKFIREHYGIQDFPWKYGNHEPNFIYNELDHFVASETDVVTKKQTIKKVIKNLANLRGHKILNSTYEHNKSSLTVYCPNHDTTYCTNVHNYKRSIFGVCCCAKVKQRLRGFLKNPGS